MIFFEAQCQSKRCKQMSSSSSAQQQPAVNAMGRPVRKAAVKAREITKAELASLAANGMDLEDSSEDGEFEAESEDSESGASREDDDEKDAGDQEEEGGEEEEEEEEDEEEGEDDEKEEKKQMEQAKKQRKTMK
jgi:hypothetical protein